MNLSDPCDPSKDVVNEAIIAMNESGDCGEVALEAAVDEVDRIHLKVLKEECPCLYDFLNRIALENSTDNWLCNTLKGMSNDPDSKLQQHFTITEGSSFHNNVSISTNPNTGGPQVFGTMSIPQGACDGTLKNPDGSDASDIQIGAKFIHEFFHAHLYDLIAEAFGNNRPADLFLLNPLTQKPDRLNPQYFSVLATKYGIQNNISTNQHEAFFNYLKQSILNSLQSLNGGGNLEHFEYYFHLLVNTNNIKDLVGLPDFDLNDSLEDWIAVGGLADGLHYFNIYCLFLLIHKIKHPY